MLTGASASVGADVLPVAHPMFQVGSLVADASPAIGAYTPSQIQQAYQFNQVTYNGAGETIAIVDAYNDPNIQSDLNTFDAQFGLPSTTVSVVNENGGAPPSGTDSTGGWELEESLDVEWAHAMAPGASILLVEANSPNESDLLTAVGYAAAHANVVSMSWGGGESSDETLYDSDFSQSGVAFVASSGDNGAPASWPAASPNVLAVGGTALTLSSTGAWASETGWSGSGGGPSAYEAQPSYQTGVVTTTTMRANPDVAYDASVSTGFSVYDSYAYEGTTYDWIEVGGTSAGAPQWSAILAIADQGRAALGQPPLDSTNPQEVMTTLYQNPGDLHDITSGTSTGSPHYSAGPGYDYVTGLGTPMVNLVVGSFDGTSTSGSNDTLVISAPSAADVGQSLSITVTVDKAGTTTADTGYTGTVHFTSTDAQAILPANYTFTAADQGVHTFSVTFGTTGTQSVTATDTANSSITGSATVTVNIPATATFLKTDTTTSGNWVGTYGSNGTDIEGYTAALPSYASVTFGPDQSITWASGVTNPIAPQAPGQSVTAPRTAGAWYNYTVASGFTVDVDLTDGQAHDVALYFLDWPGLGRSEQVQISDASSGAVLDTETVNLSGNGEYLQWKLSGNVVISIKSLNGNNAVLTGLFFDPAASTPATATASFVKSDTTTSGNWVGVYGSQGYDIEGYTAALPSYASVTFGPDQSTIWASGVTNPIAPQVPGGSTSAPRTAGAWYNYTVASGFSIDLDLTDGQAHDVALYFLDYPDLGRSEQVQISDASSGAVLDTETVNLSGNGEYLQWKLSGNVVISIKSLNGNNAVLTGLFFDPTASTTATATFLKTDTTTSGNWVGTYGSNGTDIEGYTAALPSYASVTFGPDQSITWASGVTNPIAPQAPSQSVTAPRTAGAWYNYTVASGFSIDLDLTDGQAHDVALYFLDWPGLGRSEQVQISDASSGAVLDTETVNLSGNGEYLQWKLSGNVVISIKSLNGNNAVLTGLFFDPATSPTTSLGQDATTSGNRAATAGLPGHGIQGDAAVRSAGSVIGDGGGASVPSALAIGALDFGSGSDAPASSSDGGTSTGGQVVRIRWRR